MGLVQAGYITTPHGRDRLCRQMHRRSPPLVSGWVSAISFSFKSSAINSSSFHFWCSAGEFQVSAGVLHHSRKYFWLSVRGEKHRIGRCAKYIGVISRINISRRKTEGRKFKKNREWSIPIFSLRRRQYVEVWGVSSSIISLQKCSVRHFWSFLYIAHTKNDKIADVRKCC